MEDRRENVESVDPEREEDEVLVSGKKYIFAFLLGVQSFL